MAQSTDEIVARGESWSVGRSPDCFTVWVRDKNGNIAASDGVLPFELQADYARQRMLARTQDDWVKEGINAAFDDKSWQTAVVAIEHVD